jgi:hypothetical protein
MKDIIIDSEKASLYAVTQDGSSLELQTLPSSIASSTIQHTVYEDLLRQVRRDPVFHEEDKTLLLMTYKNTQLLEAVMKYGKNSLGKPALYLATLAQDTQAIEVLVKAGAEVSEEVLFLAKNRGSALVLRLLTETKHIKIPSSYSINIVRKERALGTEWILDSKEVGKASIRKTKTHIQVKEELEGKEYEAKIRVISYKGYVPSTIKLEMYTKDGEYLGAIIGEELSSVEAHFSIYNEEGESVAVAYLEEDLQGFVMTHPERIARVIATLRKVDTLEPCCPWKMKVYQGRDLDPRVINTFIAIALDTEQLLKN